MTIKKVILTALAAVVSLLSGTAQETAAAMGVSHPDSTATETISPDARDILTVFETPATTVSVEMPQALSIRLENRVLHPDNGTTSDTVDIAADTDDDNETERPVQMSKGKIVGYRVQIYTDQNVRTGKSEARTRERTVSAAFPQYATYVTYSSPYWRLRVGDFRTQQEASKAAAEIKRAFPRFARDVRIVRDRINAR